LASLAWAIKPANAQPAAQELWRTTLDGYEHGTDYGIAVVSSPTHLVVFVTGATDGNTQGSDVITLAYRSTTGTGIWKARYKTPRVKS